MSGYDHWKSTNPEDEFLGPDPFEIEEFEEREGLMARMMDEDEAAEAMGFDSAEQYQTETPERIQQMHDDDEIPF